MNTIDSINTSFYPGLIEGFAPTTTQRIPAIEAEPYGEDASTFSDASKYSPENVDLSHYYEDVRPEDLLTKTGQNLVESAQVLDNTMVNALQNGYSVQDVCNIKLAEAAYKASAYMFNVASDISTFLLEI